MTTKSKSAKKGGSKRSTSAQKPAAKKGKPLGFAAAFSPERTVKQRIAALVDEPLAVCDTDENLQNVLSVLRDRNQPSEVRLTALQTLQAATFSVAEFESCQPDYTAALRELVDDPDDTIRRRVLGILSRDKDGYAQKRLLEGLKDPDKALVPPEKALQFLGNDVHAEAYSAARKIVENPPSEDAKREALRLLAADSKAAPIFEKVLRDKDALAEHRQISASALQGLKPKKLQEYARDIVLDENEYPEIKATSLTAITNFGPKEVAQDEKLMESVDRLNTGKTAPKVKKSAKRFLNRFR